jgi:hypothetical protein
VILSRGDVSLCNFLVRGEVGIWFVEYLYAH